MSKPNFASKSFGRAPSLGVFGSLGRSHLRIACLIRNNMAAAPHLTGAAGSIAAQSSGSERRRSQSEGPAERRAFLVEPRGLATALARPAQLWCVRAQNYLCEPLMLSVFADRPR